MVFDGFFMVIRLRVNKWYLQFSKLVSIEYYILHLAIIWGNTLLRSSYNILNRGGSGLALYAR